MVLVNHYANAAAALIFEAADHAAVAVNLHIAPRTHNVSRKQNGEPTSDPTGTSRSMAKSTPFAEMFVVSAVQSPLCDLTATGKCRGNRGALCISA